MIKISLVVPSRQRNELLKKCINSFYSKAANPSEVEMLIMMDFDDKSFNEINEYCSSLGQEIVLARRNRVPYIISAYVNPLSRMSRGEYIWGLNDECQIVQDRWDEKFLSIAESNKNKILQYYFVDDDMPKIGFCSFPILNRRFVELLNGTMPNDKIMWGSDSLLYNLCGQLHSKHILNYNPIIDIRDKITVLNESHHNGKRPRDSIYYDIVKNSGIFFANKSDNDIMIELLLKIEKDIHKVNSITHIKNTYITR